MGLADIIRSGVAIANSVTSSLQVQVTHEAWIGADKYGKPIFDTPTSRPAIVNRATAAVGGTEITQQASVTFVGPVDSNGAENRQEPIDPRDRITLPDGWSGPIVNVSGPLDPQTGQPYLYTVSLGNPGG